ncbi:MAG: hypothetical protein B6D72_11245 [gamma proteobacterium symbiont of Ctena orbiculata]|uniref:Sel1 repeat family protein n=1 Tax=Candidatus Thiodiazotropha taylori TaxID=2792791 RepID=A0A944M6I3_9GAMM|nr:hypothetical protein [Candidatus Thiodiazotropha taylori]PUB88975.1 MAG: hypothetical protein DBP00_03840 [gamma proteobacterium symbiont of Ctena orbiculata]MBT2988048.1 hypothetical protein [Candidatus Thiodiazotropha taylori]MBT2997685.1 hypothetical protein [Candidatus Thiodiazotropha taylori]MBT3001894.1 hypothetical protein [Candidatus Thiodiazotropha taylori]
MTNSDSKLPDDYAEEEVKTTTSDRLRVTLEIAIAALILVGIYYLFAPDEEIDLAPPLEESQIDPIIRAQIDSAKQTPPDATQTIPAEKQNDTTADAAAVEEQSLALATSPTAAGSGEKNLNDGGSARDLISRLRSGEASLTTEQILDQATRYQDNGRPTDAYLLLFYAAREGDGMAAYTLASMHDPNHFSEDNPLLENPDAYQAHKWYSAAADKGVAEADERLRVLRKSTEERAKKGDYAAQRLLLNWQ